MATLHEEDQCTFKARSQNCEKRLLSSSCLSLRPSILLEIGSQWADCHDTRVVTLIVATIYLQLIQNRYMFRSFTVLHCSHQNCVQPVASDVEVVGYL